jgi:hypothetical protein
MLCVIGEAVLSQFIVSVASLLALHLIGFRQIFWLRRDRASVPHWAALGWGAIHACGS